MLIKFLKKYNRFKVGDTHEFHARKAKPLIESGIAEEVKSKPKFKAKPKAEKATVVPPAEKAEVKPRFRIASKKKVDK